MWGLPPDWCPVLFPSSVFCHPGGVSCQNPFPGGKLGHMWWHQRPRGEERRSLYNYFFFFLLSLRHCGKAVLVPRATSMSFKKLNIDHHLKENSYFLRKTPKNFFFCKVRLNSLHSKVSKHFLYWYCYSLVTKCNVFSSLFSAVVTIAVILA